MRVALLGLGLIGGSIARALRRDHAAAWSIVAWTPSGRGPAAALQAGVIDEAATSPSDAVRSADIVVLAAPVPACLELLDRIAGEWAGVLAPDAVITDVASTKREIVERAGSLRLRFIGGHPMAGREADGFAAATPDLFDGRPWVTVSVPAGVADATDLDRVEAMAIACGALPVRLGATEHDDAVAGISHLPLVVAAALVETVAGGDGVPRPDWPLASRLAASGWRDTTRLARGDAAMGSGILTTNAAAVSGRIHDLIAVLEEWAAELERSGGPDGAAVAERLRSARERLSASDP
ncbi:MAG TPA: prephenate dehydrogenase/arogenate dehydrogenase family protein [Candidatus Limnocylindrales bacterium]